MRVLVTGGTGFIGSNLCQRLLQDGHEVICLDNNYTGSMDNIESLLDNPHFTFIEYDVCNSLLSCVALQECLSKSGNDCGCKAGVIDQIYNMACPASPPAYQGEHSITTTKTCVFGAINVLDLAVAHKAVVLQASTSEVYGDPDVTPQSESYRGNVNPNGIRACYDEGKRCAESLFFDYARHLGARIKVVRIFNTYGPHMDPDDGRVVSNFICQALQGIDLTVYGEGKQTRAFCYVDDLVEGLVRMMNSRCDFLGPVNLGNPCEFTVAELAQRVLELVQSSSRLVYEDLPQDDPKRRCPDISLAQKELNWHPQVDLDTGLQRSIAYFKEKLIARGLLAQD